jgi:hypothetical protein
MFYERESKIIIIKVVRPKIQKIIKGRSWNNTHKVVELYNIPGTIYRNPRNVLWYTQKVPIFINAKKQLNFLLWVDTVPHNFDSNQNESRGLFKNAR